MTRPPDRLEVVTWRAVTGPVACADCGHGHWAWKPSNGLAAQWKCDRPNCECRTLRTRR